MQEDGDFILAAGEEKVGMLFNVSFLTLFLFCLGIFFFFPLLGIR